ncbi:GNAT family N-acetyltransferase [Halococcus thailandensis]|nr:GNAT family N-acetyltransferase [Halococcus thailandensis]
MEIRLAHPAKCPAVMNVLDGASLAVDAATVRERIRANTVWIAVADDRLLGACVLDDREIDAIAVRRRRRGQGIGTRLVERAAAATAGDLRAEFHRRVRPFYDSLGFAIEPTDEPDRFRGRYE